MNFLDQIYFDNPVSSYLVVFLTIAFLLLFKRLLGHYIASLLYLVIKRKWKNIAKTEFVSLLIRPLAWLITILVSVIVIDKLNYPSAWHFKIYGLAVELILERIGLSLILIAFFWFILSLIDFIALILEQKARTTRDKSDDQLITFFRDFFKGVISVIAVLFLLKVGFNRNIGSLLTGLSIVGAALALSAKESIENLIASFIIFFDKPFFTGDILKVNNVVGTVEHIGLRSTRIRTTDKTLVTVPNKQMVDSIVDNYSMRTERRAELKLELAPENETSLVESYIAEIKKTLEGKKGMVCSYSVFFSEFSKNGITITVEYFTIHLSMNEFNELKQAVNIELKRTIEKLNLQFAAGSGDIKIFNTDANAGAAKSQPII